MDSITDNIWIGNYLDAKDRASLVGARIRSILCLDGCMAGMKADDVGVERVEAHHVEAPRRNHERASRGVGFLTNREKSIEQTGCTEPRDGAGASCWVSLARGR